MWSFLLHYELSSSTVDEAFASIALAKLANSSGSMASASDRRLAEITQSLAGITTINPASSDVFVLLYQTMRFVKELNNQFTCIQYAPKLH